MKKEEEETRSNPSTRPPFILFLNSTNRLETAIFSVMGIRLDETIRQGKKQPRSIRVDGEEGLGDGGRRGKGGCRLRARVRDKRADLSAGGPVVCHLLLGMLEAARVRTIS
jgi:hypothetical protein